MSLLLSPVKIRGIVFRNRIGISPMCQYRATDGFANDWHLVHYGSRAVGGAGLIIQEATAVAAEGRITPGDLGLYHAGQVEKLKQLTDFIIAEGAVPAIQLAHAGRKASCALPWQGGLQLSTPAGGWQTVAPSALPFNETDELPAEMSPDAIRKVISDFILAASRALEAGYQVIDLHAAHGYLLHQFLSPITNHRTDSYGGSFENRTRLLLEVVDGIRTIWPENLPLFVRISATDWVEGGWNPEEAVALSSKLKEKGVDLIDCSTGGLVPYARIPVGRGFQVPFAERIKTESGILTSAVGWITSAKQAEEVLGKGSADLILFGRESLREPYLAFKAAKELDEEFTYPLPYLRAKL